MIIPPPQQKKPAKRAGGQNERPPTKMHSATKSFKICSEKKTKQNTARPQKMHDRNTDLTLGKHTKWALLLRITKHGETKPDVCRI